jgi:hypothetical protein
VKKWAVIILSLAMLPAHVCMASSILSIDFSGAELEVPLAPGTDTPLQPGYVGWSGPYLGNPGSDYNETRQFNAGFGIAGMVSVTLRSDALFFRDYDPIVGGPFVDLSPLLSDSILMNQPGSIFLTFDSLLPGTYAMTSFHHDTRFGSTFIPFDIILTDSLVNNQTLFSGLDTTGGTSPSSVLIATYGFTVLGGSPVVIEFSGQAQLARHMAINGFQLERTGPPAPVPEPSSLSLLAMGLLLLPAVIAFRRRWHTYR